MVDLEKKKQVERNYCMEAGVNLKLRAVESAWIKQQNCILKRPGNFK